MRLFRLAAIGAALVYFFDPNNGRRRRNMTRDRALAFFRRTGQRSGKLGARAAAETTGAAQKIKHVKEADKPQPDDVTLARKVETEIFRDADAPKGTVDVNAENGVVYLRGEADSEDMIRELEQATRQVKGVQDVQNLLHLPGTAAPTRVGSA